MQKAVATADSDNAAADAAGGGSAMSPLVFDDGNLVLNVIDNNSIIQIKDKEMVFMTTEVVVNFDKTIRGKLTSMALRLNEAVGTHLQEFENSVVYLNKFKDYLNQNGDSAEIESDVDGGITFCCLITTKELEELVEAHEKFLEQAS